jgi:diguanylate cyclase (GGDEF)-like protein
MLEGQKRISEQFEDMATFDALTGAYNRRKFKYFIEREIEKAEKYGNPFSINMLDIDNFKQVNDVGGHNKGDHVLKDVVSLIKNTLRATDRLFRWGGDEFIILLPDLNMDNALKVADRLRERIESNILDSEGKGITVSLGIGTFEANETTDQFVARVDKALLRAKSSGKNIVVKG